MSTETHFFSGEGGGRLFEVGAYYKFLSLRRGANSKRGTYLKLGADSSIYGILLTSVACVMSSRERNVFPSPVRISTSSLG